MADERDDAFTLLFGHLHASTMRRTIDHVTRCGNTEFDEPSSGWRAVGWRVEGGVEVLTSSSRSRRRDTMRGTTEWRTNGCGLHAT